MDTPYLYTQELDTFFKTNIDIINLHACQPSAELAMAILCPDKTNEIDYTIMYGGRNMFYTDGVVPEKADDGRPTYALMKETEAKLNAIRPMWLLRQQRDKLLDRSSMYTPDRPLSNSISKPMTAYILRTSKYTQENIDTDGLIVTFRKALRDLPEFVIASKRPIACCRNTERFFNDESYHAEQANFDIPSELLPSSIAKKF